MSIHAKSIFAISTLLLLFASCQSSQVESEVDSKDQALKELLERAESFEIKSPFVLPPGKAEVHHASGFAKNLCSAVFVTGLDFDFAAEAIGYFTSPYEERGKVAGKVLDMEEKAVHVTLHDGTVRTAKYYGDQGCVCLPIGEEQPYFEPQKIVSALPDAEITPWPMGDLIENESIFEGLDGLKISQAVNAAFAQQEGLTAAFVVTHRGKIIGERYRNGITMHTSLESWSMGKSLTGTLLATLINDGVYELYQPAPIPEWQSDKDPRKKIRIADIMRMSSGIKFRAPQDPNFDPSIGYPDHLYVYTGSVNSFEYAASLPPQWPPNTIGRYHNSDPVLANYLVRLGVEGRGGDYLSFPTRALFDKLGMRNMVLETDPYGNFLLQGYEFGSGRDWARLGNLYLQDGMWNGERLLPEGYVSHVSTLAPAWLADKRPVYGGGFFWINGSESWPIPKESYFMAGAGGQFTFIIPSHELVVVRLGHYKGSSKGVEDLKNALSILMEAVPAS